MRKSEAVHIDHFAEKVYVGSSHDGSARKPVSIQEDMKMPEAKAAVEKEWEKLKKISAWNGKKVKSKSEVVAGEPVKMEKTVHFANLMEVCHLKNAELAKHLQ